MSKEVIEYTIGVVLERNNKVVINALNGIIEFLDMGKPDLAREFILNVIEILGIGEEE
tara:strand:- start:445 stop:618 length:174 start_codon:yes stop_codon:yes gene_type:complete